MANLIPPPQVFTLPITKGCDLAFTLNRKDAAGDAVDWDADVYINIVTGTTTTKVDAVVVDDTAAFQVEASVTDELPSGSVWRIVMSSAGDPTLETPVAVGKFKRFDG